MIGLLRHRITFQEESQTPDGAGGFVTSWVNIASQPNVWAKIKPVSGTEVFQAMQLQARVTHRVLIRYRDDLNTAMRIQKGSRVFNIRSLRNLDERGAYLEILAEEGQDI